MPHRRMERHGFREAARGVLAIASICIALIVAGAIVAAVLAEVVG